MPPWVWAFDSVKRTNLNGASTMDKVAEVCGCVSILSRGQRDRRLQLFLVGSWNCCFTLQQMLFEPQQLWRHQQIAADTMQRCQQSCSWIHTYLWVSNLNEVKGIDPYLWKEYFTIRNFQEVLRNRFHWIWLRVHTNFFLSKTQS